jgi:hypothetical protein
VVRIDGSEAALAHMGNRVSNYRFEVNVPAMITQNLLTGAVQLQIRWNGQRVNQNEIPVVSCGMFDGPCCSGRCTQGSCINNVCSRCGDLGQACCPSGTQCTTRSTGCSAGRCVACPPPATRQRLFNKTGEQAGPTCFSGTHETRTYSGRCHAGFHREGSQPQMAITTACDVCTASASWASGDTGDCTVKIRFDTPGDCGKFIQVNLEVWEIQNTPPPPAGCP